MPLKRVLSIQSHVVSGYVGNKSATFPLQVNLYGYRHCFTQSVYIILFNAPIASSGLFLR